MKKLFLLVPVLLLLAAGSGQSVQTLAIGSDIPLANLKMKDISGKEVSIKDARGLNGVMVMFSCNTCPVVIKNQARTKAITAYAKQHQIGVILLNSNEATRNGDDSYAAMQAYARKQGYDCYYAVDQDSRIANAFGATRTPEIYLFDIHGKLQYKGAIDDNPSNAGAVTRIHAREAINEMTAGKEVSVKTSKSLGCSIRRKE
jgi:hypothetical protein